MIETITGEIMDCSECIKPFCVLYNTGKCSGAFIDPYQFDGIAEPEQEEEECK